MKNKKFRPGIPAAVLAFCVAVIGCGGGDALNGTWRGDNSEMEMSGGSFEDTVDGVSSSKGTYSTGNGKITLTITHLHGDFLNNASGGEAGLEPEWYSKDDLQADIPEEVLEKLFAEMTLDYLIDGDTLTIGTPPRNTVYTRN